MFRFQYFVALCDTSRQDWTSQFGQDFVKHILFKGKEGQSNESLPVIQFTLDKLNELFIISQPVLYCCSDRRRLDRKLSFCFLFLEDLDNIRELQDKLGVPAFPPDPNTISQDIMALHNTIAARHVGAASLIRLKTPEEGFNEQRRLLQDVRENSLDGKLYRLSNDQLAVFQTGPFSFTIFGGHGSGKIILTLHCTMHIWET